MLERSDNVYDFSFHVNSLKYLPYFLWGFFLWS